MLRLLPLLESPQRKNMTLNKVSSKKGIVLPSVTGARRFSMGVASLYLNRAANLA